LQISVNNCTLNYAVYNTTPVAWKLTDWVIEMSDYIKTLDRNHLVAVGDEGFLCESYQACPDTTCACYYGVDTRNFTKSPSIDFMSLHLYPLISAKWGTDWINQHADIALKEIKKPVLLGEYGSRNNQHTTYQDWTNAVYSSVMNGDLFWMLAGRDEDGQWVPNYDGYEVYCPDDSQQTPGSDPQSCGVLTTHATRMNG